MKKESTIRIEFSRALEGSDQLWYWRFMNQKQIWVKCLTGFQTMAEAKCHLEETAEGKYE